MKHLAFVMFLVAAVTVSGPAQTDETLRVRAQELAQTILIVDTHIDVPYRLHHAMEDISARTEGGEFDYPRAREGGLNLPFMSIYVPSSTEGTGRAKPLADTLIDMVEGFVKKWPASFAIATSVSDVTAHWSGGMVLLAMGMENGSPIEGDLGNVAYFHRRGIRYITLAHAQCNHICDSSYDTERRWNGLSPFGRKVVTEMNRVGIMVDVSHISDSAFYQVMRVSQAPVIASHSSCRFFTPGFERNMTDDMIRLLAEHRGVIQINFGSTFLRNDVRLSRDKAEKDVAAYLTEHSIALGSDEAHAYTRQFEREHPQAFADISDVVAHIDHVVALVGEDCVGLGSDFDGVGDSLPVGLKDVSAYPNLIYRLLKKGYSEESIRKICGGNLMRVWRDVENVAAKLQKG